MPLRDPFADLIAPRESDPFGDLIASVEPAAPSRPASTPSQSRYEALLQLDVPRARTSDLPLAGRGSMPADRTVEEQRVIEEAPVYNQPSVPRPSVPDPASRHDPFVSPETVAEYERAKAMHARQGYPLNNDPESSFLNDMRLALVQGGVGIAKGAVGLADMASQAGEAIAGNIAAGRIPTDPTGAILPSPVRVPQLGQQLSDAGIRFDDIQAGLESGKTDALRGQSQAFQEADGIMRKAGIAATSPRLIVDAALQSLPGMVASGAVASRLLGSTPLAAAVGEGGFMAGTDATAMREESPDGRLSKEQMALSAAIGFIGGAIGRASNALAKTLGTTDVDGLLVGIARNPSSRQSFARNIALNYVQEGSEEVAQGIFETALTNLGTGKPLTDGMAADALLGFAVGGAMGAGAEVAQIPAGLVERREARQAQAADDARRAENTAAFNAANEVYNQRFTPEGRATALEQWRQEQQAQAAPPASPENVRAAFDRMRAGRSAATTTEEQANIPVETAPIGQDIGQPIGQEPEVSDSAAPWSNDGINESSLLKTHQANYSPMASFDDLIAPVEASQTASTSAQVSTDSTQQFVKAAKVSVELDGTGALVVRFVKQPSYGTLESLKSRGFRWSKEDKAWYHRNPERLTTERGDDALRFAIQKTRALVGLPIDEDLRKPDFDYNEERKRRASTPSTQAAGASMEPDSFDMAPRERVSDDEARAALTDEDRVSDAPAGAGRDWPLILGHARAQGYTGSAEALLRAKQDIEGFEAAGREETDSTDTGVELLKAIRDAGGIKDDGGGEFATLWEASTGFVPQGKTKAGDRYKKSRNYATGGLLGVGNVLRKYGEGGRSWDYIREALSQEPAFRRFADMSATDLMNEVMEVVGTRTAQGQGREGRARGVDYTRPGWWQDRVNNAGYTPVEQEAVDFLGGFAPDKRRELYEALRDDEDQADAIGVQAEIFKRLEQEYANGDVAGTDQPTAAVAGSRADDRTAEQSPRRAGQGAAQVNRANPREGVARPLSTDTLAEDFGQREPAEATMQIASAMALPTERITTAKGGEPGADAINQGVEDYAGSHRPPGPDDGAPLHDLTGDGKIYPDDVYRFGEQYYGTGDDALDREAFGIARRLKGQPSARVRVYRAVPVEQSNEERIAELEQQKRRYLARNEVPDGERAAGWYERASNEIERLRALPPQDKQSDLTINAGDWVSITRRYAKGHGESALDGRYKILSKLVRADEIFTNGDSIHEWGYWPGGKRPSNDDPLYQSAYHGSPHIFDKFSLHAIGSGEGAQAYGWGIYAASRKEVAEYYRTALSKRLDTPEYWERISATLPDDLTSDERSDLNRITDKLAQNAYKNGPPLSVSESERWGELRSKKRVREEAIDAARPKGRLYKVEIPEDEDFLLWDKPASKQSEKVQDALRALGVEWTPLKPLTPKQYLHWVNSKVAAQLWRSDVGIRASMREGIQLAEAGDVQGFTHWFGQHQGLFKKGAVDPTGESLYLSLQASRGSADVPYREWARLASEALASQGVAGIKYLDGTSRRSGDGTYNYVVFDDKLVQIMEFEQRQRSGGIRRASVEFSGGLEALRQGTETALIRALDAPNASSGVHEIAHIARRWLLNRDVPAEQRVGITDRDIAITETWAGVSDGKWTTAAEEKFARGFERYLRDGVSPTPRLSKVFKAFATWLRDIYQSVIGSEIDVEISDEMRTVYDRLVTRAERIASGEAAREGQATSGTRTSDVALPGLERVRGQALGAVDQKIARVSAQAPEDGFTLSAERADGRTLTEREQLEDAGQRSMFDLDVKPEVRSALATSEQAALDRLRKKQAGGGVLYQDARPKRLSRFALDKPIKGQGGNSLVGYEWRWTYGERERADGDVVAAKVSDWDNFATSEGTGRKIVHVFYVQHADGRVTEEGINSAQSLLGIQNTRLRTIAEKEAARQKVFRKNVVDEVNDREANAFDSIGEAARNWWSRNRVATEADFKQTYGLTKDGKHIRYMGFAESIEGNKGSVKPLWPAMLDEFKARGWTVEAIGSTPADTSVLYQADLPTNAVDTSSESFKRWFGQSKVVDKSGKPLRVYHGTPEKGIESFREGMAFFTSNQALADGYTAKRGLWLSSRDGEVVQAYLALENPLVIDALGKRSDNIPVPWQAWSAKVFGTLPKNAVSVRAAAEKAQALGHDGLIVRNVIDTPSSDGTTRSDVYVAFSPTQIKSATSNRGTFDPTNPSILYQSDAAEALPDDLPFDDRNDLLIVGAAKMARGLTDFRKWSEAMRADLGEALGPNLRDLYTASRNRAVLLSKFNPDEYFNFKRSSLTGDTLESLRASVIDTVLATGRIPKERETWDEIKVDAEYYGPEIVKYLAPFQKQQAQFRVVRYAAKQRIDVLKAEIYADWQRIDRLRLKGELDPAAYAVEERKIAAKERDVRGLLDVWMRMRSEDGRNLAMHRIIAERTWDDYEFWTKRAKRAMGLPPGVDLPREVEKRINEIIQGGKVRLAERKARAPREASPKPSGPPSSKPRVRTFTPKTDGQAKRLALVEQMKAAMAAKAQAIAGNVLYQIDRATKAVDTSSEAFKRWFGKSKVVDDSGKPLRVYHGTDKRFSRFDSALALKGNVHSLTYGVPMFFSTNSKRTARTYGRRVMPLYVSLQNPLVVDARGNDFTYAFSLVQDELPVSRNASARAFTEYRDSLIDKYGDDAWERADDLRAITTPEEYERLKSLQQAAEDDRSYSPSVRQYDGIIIKNVIDTADGSTDFATVYAAFRPEQIKSATSNAGTFDPNKPSIFYQADTVQAQVDADLVNYARQFLEMAKADGLDAESAWDEFSQMFADGYEGQRDAFEEAAREVFAPDVVIPKVARSKRRTKLDDLRGLGREDDGSPEFADPNAGKPTRREMRQRETEAAGAFGADTSPDGMIEDDGTVEYAEPVAPPTAEERTAQSAANKAARTAREDTASGAFGQDIEDEVKRDLAKMLMGLDKSGPVETVLALRKAGLLTGVKTALRNIGGNTAFQALEEVARIPSSLVDMALALYSGQRTVAGMSPVAFAKATREAATKGIADAAAIMRGEKAVDAFLKTGERRELNSGYKWLDAYANTVFRFLSAQDAVFKSYAFRRSMEEQATLMAKERGVTPAELLLQPTEAMIVRATADAEFATFNNPNMVAKAWNSGVSTLKRNGPGGQAVAAVAEFVVPFTNTPSNIIARLFDYMGVTAAGTVPAHAWQAYVKDGLTPEHQRVIAQALGRGFTGSALVYAGYMLAAAGKMTGGGEDEDKGDRNLATAAGRLPGAILIGDRWHSISAFSPVGMLLTVGASLHRRHTKPEANKSGIVAEGFRTGAQIMLDQPMLSGMQDTLNFFRRDGQERYIASQAGSFIPTIVSDAASLFDPYRRETRTDGFLPSLWAGVQARLPGARNYLPQRVDVLGRTQDQIASNAVNPLLSTPAKELSDPVLKALLDADVGVTFPVRKQGETDDAYNARVAKTGQMIERYVKATVSAPGFARLPLDVRTKSLKGAIDRAKDAVPAPKAGATP